MKMLRAVPLFCLTLFVGAPTFAFDLVGTDHQATVFICPDEPECVRLAVDDLLSDVQKITSKQLAIVPSLEEASADCVVVGSVMQPGSLAALKRFDSSVDELQGKWEAYRVTTASSEVGPGPVKNCLLIAGSDERGTMFAIYAFIEQYLGVDPMYFWTDRQPARRDTLSWSKVDIVGKPPTFRYRGWFLNDEDLLTEWHLDGGRRDIDYAYYHLVTSPKASPHVFEALLRLQYNLVIPASFVDIRNPNEERLIEEATRRGLFVTMHHIEPLGVSGFGFLNYYRDRGENVPFSFTRHPEKFEAIWRDYAARWAKYGDRVIWQLGLRGIADRPVWVSDPKAPKTDEGRGKLISDAMALQWEIVRNVDPRPNPPATTTLWMEGASLHNAGHLKFPPGVAVIFSDNSPGWKLQDDFYNVEREPKRNYGVYYHQQLWGTGPHLTQALSPQKIHSIFKLAVDRGSNYYAIMNVGNVREFALGVDAGARMLRDFNAFDPDAYFSDWCQQRFGPAAKPAERCYRKLFASYVDPQTNRRRRLDGETRHAGTRFLESLAKQAKGQETLRISDPKAIRRELARTQAQREAVEQAGKEADNVLGQLQGQDRVFFENNFVAQQQILLGILEWLENSYRAGLALNDGDRKQGIQHLDKALDGMQRVRDAKALASRGDKWENWYRGDKKMNLPAAEALTRRLAETLRNEGN